MFKSFCLLSMLATCSYAQAQVLIITHAFNRPDFIEIQHKTFKEFFLDDYEFIVFSDAQTNEMAQQINDTCIKLNIRCIRIPQEIHDRPYLYRLPEESYHHPCVRCANVVQYSLDTIGFDHDDIVMIIDSDMFLVKPFSARQYLKGYTLSGFKPYWTEIEYLWNGLLFFDMRTLPNKRTLDFNCGRVNNIPVDVGGQTYHYLKNNPATKVRFIKNCYSDDLHCVSCKNTNQLLCSHNTAELLAAGFDENQIKFLQAAHRVEFLHENSFLHYRSGGNWNNKDARYHQMKTEALHTYLTTILE